MILDLLLEGKPGGARIAGVVVAVVTDTRDPEGLGRVKARFPLLDGEKGEVIGTSWVRLTSFFAGKDRGAFFLPKVGDEVLVSFAYGNVNLPYVIGFLWNGEDRPPVKKDKQQAVREIRTSAGQVVRFDETAGRETIEIADAKGNRIVVDTKGGKVTIEAKQEVALAVKAGKISLAAREIALAATAKLALTAPEVEVAGRRKVAITGAQVDLN